MWLVGLVGSKLVLVGLLGQFWLAWLGQFRNMRSGWDRSLRKKEFANRERNELTRLFGSFLEDFLVLSVDFISTFSTAGAVLGECFCEGTELRPITFSRRVLLKKNMLEVGLLASLL